MSPPDATEVLYHTACTAVIDMLELLEAELVRVRGVNVPGAKRVQLMIDRVRTAVEDPKG